MDLSRECILYREWSFGRKYGTDDCRKKLISRITHWQKMDINLGMVLNRVRGDPKSKKEISLALRQLYHGIDDFDVKIERVTVQVFLTGTRHHEYPPRDCPMVRFRYLCLLAILCLPAPASVICLEEPELGLHPDILPGLR